MNDPDLVYVVMQEIGICRICGSRDDLRMGACFTCSDQVDGRPIPGGHELWDSKNPMNCWRVKDT